MDGQGAQVGPDALILDVEDAVPIAEKSRTRPIVRAGIERLAARGVAIFVRVNSVETGLTGEDVEAIVQPGLVAIAVPKLQYVEEVRKVDAWIELFERKAGMPVGTVRIVVLPKTARGIKDVYHLLQACPRVGNVCGAPSVKSGDVTKAIGCQWTEGGLEMLYVAQHTLLAARGGHCVSDHRRAAGDPQPNDRRHATAPLPAAGLSGGAADPSLAGGALQRGIRAIEGGNRLEHGGAARHGGCRAAGRAAVTYDGMMIDYAHVRNALDLLHQAEAFGLPVGDIPAIRAL